MNIEAVGESYNVELVNLAQRQTREIAELIFQKVEVGMTEDDGYQLVEQVYKDFDIKQKWHPTKFRIGANTTKSFRDISEPNIKLEKDSIYFVDLGPVIKGHEGDFGKTYVLGDRPEFEAVAKASQSVFSETKSHWQATKATGKELYQFAVERAQHYGYHLNEQMKGHRLSEFPHALHYRWGLNAVDITPSPERWILEIHLIDVKNNIGAFFEDIL